MNPRASGPSTWVDRGVHASRPASRRSAAAARAVRQPEVGRRQGRARRPRRAGARARNRGDRPAPGRRSCQRWSTTPWRAARTRSASPAATGRSPSSPQLPSRTGFRSSASRPAPATTSRSTSASTAATCVGSLDAFTDGRRAPDRRRGGERPPLPQQRLARDLRRRGSAADLPRRQGAHAARDGGARARTERAPQPACSSWTTAAARIATPQSCSCRTTRTRSSPRVRPAPARRSTAASSASIVLDRPTPASSPGRSVDRDASSR